MTLAPECSFAWDGAALSIFLGAIPLAVVLTVLTLFLYRWAIGRAMRAAARDTAPPPAAVPSGPPARPLRVALVSPETSSPGPPAREGIRQTMRRLTTAYSLAGLAHATLLMFWLSGLELRPFRAAAVWTIFLWPAIVALLTTATVTRVQRASVVGGYFAVVLVLEILAETLGMRERSWFGELFLLWGLIMGAPTLVVVLLANRAWRSVGLLALFCSFVLVAALVLGFQLLGCLVLSTRSGALLSAMNYLLAAIVLVCGALAWQLLRHTARLYRDKRQSDQMFALDRWWLLVTATEILFQMSTSGVAAFSFVLAYLAYRLVLGATLHGFRLAAWPGTPRPLLLLRVFGHAARVRGLTDQVGHTWRHVGPINMIGGTDLATAFLEPDELMGFLGGRLRQGFIAGPADLAARMEGLDEKRDPDGRYRINEFFCHDNTWRATVHALAPRGAVVLMDLRGFGKANRGCEFEIGMLLDEVPLGRVVLLVDGSTRMGDLEPLLQAAWSGLSAASPNRPLAEPVVHLFQAADSGMALQPLLARLRAAASGLG
jgi:hypothetical protein